MGPGAGPAGDAAALLRTQRRRRRAAAVRSACGEDAPPSLRPGCEPGCGGFRRGWSMACGSVVVAAALLLFLLAAAVAVAAGRVAVVVAAGAAAGGLLPVALALRDQLA